MRLSKYEMETIVNYNLGEDRAIVYTRDFTVIKKLDALVAEFPREYRLLRSTDIDRTYEMPKYLVNFRRPKRQSAEKRDLAREQINRLNRSK